MSGHARARSLAGRQRVDKDNDGGRCIFSKRERERREGRKKERPIIHNHVERGRRWQWQEWKRLQLARKRWREAKEKEGEGIAKFDSLLSANPELPLKDLLFNERFFNTPILQGPRKRLVHDCVKFINGPS